MAVLGSVAYSFIFEVKSSTRKKTGCRCFPHGRCYPICEFDSASVLDIKIHEKKTVRNENTVELSYYELKKGSQNDC